jgi:hypothetical protein
LLRGAAVFVLCTVLSVTILDATLLWLSSATATLDEIVTGSLIFLPFIVAGGVIFGGLLLLTTEQEARAKSGRMLIIGGVSGLLYSAIILFSFGAIVPNSLYLVGASGIAGSISGLLWSRLVERYD